MGRNGDVVRQRTAFGAMKRDDASLERGRTTIRKNYESSVAKGRMSVRRRDAVALITRQPPRWLRHSRQAVEAGSRNMGA